MPESDFLNEKGVQIVLSSAFPKQHLNSHQQWDNKLRHLGARSSHEITISTFKTNQSTFTKETSLYSGRWLFEASLTHWHASGAAHQQYTIQNVCNLVELLKPKPKLGITHAFHKSKCLIKTHPLMQQSCWGLIYTYDKKCFSQMHQPSLGHDYLTKNRNLANISHHSMVGSEMSMLTKNPPASLMLRRKTLLHT